MTEQLLFIDNKAMDINESTNITLNFRSNIFSDVSKITSNNTYSIKLPLTVNNCHVINYAPGACFLLILQGSAITQRRPAQRS